MKIGILIWDLSIRGGTQRQALELAVHLQKIGEQVVVYTNILDHNKCYRNLLEQLTIKSRNGEIEENNFTKGIKVFSKYPKEYIEFEEIMDNNLDILNPHDQKVYIVADIHKKKYGTPVIWNMNDLPYKGHSLSFFQKKIKKICGLDYLINSRTKKYVKDFEKIIVLDNQNRQTVKQILRKESEVVRSGLDISAFKFREKKINLSNIRIFSNGVIYPHRRIEDTIKAISILKKNGYNIYFDYVGAQSRAIKYVKKLYRLIDKLTLNNFVRFHNTVDEKGLLDFYQKADFFVFPNTPQTWGLAVFEAMAIGVPVIVSKSCGATEVLTHMENSILISPKNPEQIANSVIKLIEDNTLKEKIVKQARLFVEDNIRWDLFATKILKIMKDIVAGYVRE